MSSGRSKFRKATLEVRFIPVPHCGIGKIACWCNLLAIEEISRRLGLTLATCGYIVLQGCTIIIVARTLRALATGPPAARYATTLLRYLKFADALSRSKRRESGRNKRN